MVVLHGNYLFEKIIQILKINVKTNKNVPTILSKKAPRRCQSFLSFRKVIMWDSKTSLAFWRPKNTHSLVIPFSIKVCFTIFSGSLSKVTTFCWTISCKAWSSKKGKQRKMWSIFFLQTYKASLSHSLEETGWLQKPPLKLSFPLSFPTMQSIEG